MPYRLHWEKVVKVLTLTAEKILKQPHLEYINNEISSWPSWKKDALNLKEIPIDESHIIDNRLMNILKEPYQSNT